MRWLPALVLAALLAPAALAQLPVGGGPVQSLTSVSVDDPGRALQPGKFELVLVIVNYRWNAGGTPAPGPDPSRAENDTQPTRVTLAVKQLPSWVANATFDPPELLMIVEPPVPGNSGTASSVVDLVLGIAPDAPALQREEIVVTATAEPNGNIAGSSGESPPVKLRGAVIAKLNVTSEPSKIVPGGRWTPMPFTVRNVGNTELKVKLNVTARPQDSQVEYPETVTLPRNGSAVVEVRLRVPWTGAETGIVELEATPLTEDESGTPARASIEVLGQSAVPVPGPLLALLAAWLLAKRAPRGESFRRKS